MHSGPVTVLGVITITATPSSSLSTAPLSTLVPMPVKTTNQNVSVITNTPTSTTQVIASTSRTNTSSISSSGHNVGATSILESTSVLSAFSKLVTDTPNQTNTDLPRPTTSIPSASSQSSRSHIPQIIGGTLGSFLSIILLIGLFIFYRRRWRRSWQLPSSRSPDTEKQKEFEAPSRSESMVQPLTRRESYTSTSTSPFSPLSQHTFYLSYTDGFLRRLDSDPHRHDRDASVASSSSHLTARQFLLHERASSLRDEADWLRQTISFVTSSDHIVGELQATIWRLEEHVRRLEAEHESDWALYQSDEPPPVYMEAIRRSQSNSHSENI
ncbi:uncharacterized protein EV420DRAFT_891656 [Desarmillaria tabescens]|uniref:Transmembrane protein n=1 Tax=Armillaria tabescens TaxID=1929756 RepID=A0AA39JS86_ARMTA|nr:uncharacterized protein EV420DRAFT_891656 [Desarmillaria tabescens]KAK0446514.1 hypothetical protein EV420DRAFT_891656 [Desarmillaria tabescens]